MGRGDAAHMQSVLGRLPTAAHCSLQIVKDPKIHIKCPRPQQKKNTFCSPITFLTMHVLPPANGKKLWRVKRRLVSGSMAQTDASSLECFNSLMKMSAAGKQSMARRPPLKRPKLKPGMPKDFVFVDLSPVKSDSDGASASFVKNGDNSPNIAATAPIPPPLQSPRPDESIGGCFVGNGAELSQIVPGGAYEGYDTSGASSPTTCFSHNLPRWPSRAQTRSPTTRFRWTTCLTSSFWGLGLWEWSSQRTRVSATATTTTTTKTALKMPISTLNCPLRRFPRPPRFLQWPQVTWEHIWCPVCPKQPSWTRPKRKKAGSPQADSSSRATRARRAASRREEAATSVVSASRWKNSLQSNRQRRPQRRSRTFCTLQRAKRLRVRFWTRWRLLCIRRRARGSLIWAGLLVSKRNLAAKLDAVKLSQCRCQLLRFQIPEFPGFPKFPKTSSNYTSRGSHGRWVKWLRESCPPTLSWRVTVTSSKAQVDYVGWLRQPDFFRSVFGLGPLHYLLLWPFGSSSPDTFASTSLALH